MRVDRRSAQGFALAALALLCACAGGPDEEIGDVDVAVVVNEEDVAVVTTGRIESGPLLSGSLQPERTATLLAEISGAVLRVSAEPGQSVASGASLIQIEDAALRESVLSARAAVTTAESAATLARRQVERSQALYDAGAIAQRQLEDARFAAESATAQLRDAEARLALAQNQAAKANVRAPFAGVVSDRPVNRGDVVQPGTTLITIVDPTSMRLEASVPASELELVRVGAEVEFVVTGYQGRTFIGRVTRSTPTVDPVTRQVTVYATIPNAEGRLVGGLYAEGRLAAESHSGLLVPETAVDLASAPPTALRLRHGVVELAPIEVGLRDEALERIEVVAGLAAGDTVLLGGARTLAPGTPVQVGTNGGGAGVQPGHPQGASPGDSAARPPASPSAPGDSAPPRPDGSRPDSAPLPSRADPQDSIRRSRGR
jgi:membrane fusion protein (multidrug efflux system)